MSRYSDKRKRKAREQSTFTWVPDWDRWSEDERLSLYFMEIAAIKRILYRRPSRCKSPVYKPETVKAYWDELMTRMPEGREPQKANKLPIIPKLHQET